MIICFGKKNGAGRRKLETNSQANLKMVMLMSSSVLRRTYFPLEIDQTDALVVLLRPVNLSYLFSLS
jgi:hypothetical protein